jgi:hypothetical protein
MEKRLAKKFDTHIVSFKDEIKEWFVENNCQVEGEANTSDFLKFIYDFDGIALNKEDFLKRKRVKSIVPQYERCGAKRANGDQCTRRKKEGECFCGTHSKGTPHGEVDIASNSIVSKTEQLEVWVQEIKGIHYYIDKSGNVYKVEDVISNKKDPLIIAQYECLNGEYTIPAYQI